LIAPAAARTRQRVSVVGALLRREAILVALVLFATLFFGYRWSVDLQRPGTQYPEGWRGYIDQGSYFREAVRLGHLEKIPREEFAYGPGYPALAAPFARIGKNGWPLEDPFLPANALTWLLAVAATYLVGRRLGGEPVGVVSAIALMLATPLVGLITLPWNTTASLAALMLVMLVALAPNLRCWHGATLGFAVGLAYSARYADALWVAIAALTVLLARGALSKRNLNVLVGVLGGASVAVVPTLWLQWLAFGNPFTRPTAIQQLSASSFDLHDIAPHALDTFVSPFFFSENGLRSPAQPLLSSMPLLVLMPVGFVLLVRRSSGPRRRLVFGFALASLSATLFYLSYWNTGPYGLGFGAVHYFKMWFPLWTIAAAVVAVEGFNRLARRRTP
jgi:hypothetical protein